MSTQGAIAGVDLTRFCTGAQTARRSRRDMTRPFRFRGWMYATDGHVCVRMKSPGKATLPNSRRPGVDELEWAFSFSTGVWRELAALEEEPDTLTERCGFKLPMHRIEMVNGTFYMKAFHYDNLRRLPEIEYFNVWSVVGGIAIMRMRFSGGEALIAGLRVDDDPATRKMP